MEVPRWGQWAQPPPPKKKSWLAPSPNLAGPQIVARFPNLAALLIRCDQLILGKISNFDANRCQILKLKCTKFDFLWGSATDPAAGAYSAPADPLAVFKVPASKGRAGRWGGE